MCVGSGVVCGRYVVSLHFMSVGCITLSSGEICLGVSLISWDRVDGVSGGGFDPLRLYFPLGWVLHNLLVAADLRAREL